MPVLRPSSSDFTSFVKAAAQYIAPGRTAKISKSGGVSVALPGLGAVVRTSQVGALASPSTSAVIINGVTPPPAAAASGPLYAFTTFTFTPAGATGRNGPTLSAAVSAYTATAPWVTNTSYFNMTTQGYQLWTVPQTGSYTVRAAGAGSAANSSGFGLGAIIQTTLSLTKGQKIRILVGQRGRSSGVSLEPSGGGGGSFVASGLTPATGVVLVAAGGGGGSSDPSTGLGNNNGTNTTSGRNGAGGDGGGGGSSGDGGGGAGYSGGGGGFTGNGYNGGFAPNTVGLSFINGGTGGDYAGIPVGGFGGGGSGLYGGGGGGYSGGGSASDSAGSSAGGGGSFPAGATFIGATNVADGYVIITAI